MGRRSFLPFILLFIFLVGLGKEGSCTAVRHSVNGCSAWRTSVESGNARGWKVVPSRCVSNVGKYMERGQYLLDFKVAVEQSLAYVNNLELHGDGKDAWVFDIDESTLSNLPYYRNHQYGGEAYNSTAFDAWVAEGTAPVLSSALQLYNFLMRKGVKIFFITGRDEDFREVTSKNLMRAGYRKWSGLIMRGEKDQGSTAVKYKSGKRDELMKNGYRILGNVGDQWSDLTGSSVGSRTFKLPNPMYYIS